MADCNNSLATWQAQFAGYLLQAAFRPEAGLQTWLDPGPGADTGACKRIDSGLRVYRNNVIHSLTHALAAQFPVVQRLVGAEFFGAIARDYVRQEPPLDPSLTYYGHLFADFIASFPACHALPYLADVAALELQCQRALHAADDPLLDLAHLGAVPPEQLVLARFTLHGSAFLFTSPWPVDDIWAVNVAQSDEEIRLAPQDRRHILIYRRGLAVQVLALQPSAFMLLQQLQSGQSLQQAWTVTAELHALDTAELAPLLGYLLGLDVFTRVRLPLAEDNS